MRLPPGFEPEIAGVEKLETTFAAYLIVLQQHFPIKNKRTIA